MNDMRLEPGTILAGKYRLEGVIGVGGMGTVYQAEHLALKAPVAIKVIDREVEEGDVALSRFMREAQSAASLRSPHVVQILDYGMEGRRPFMVMEMLEGEPLNARIKRLGTLSPGETFRVISHVAKAVAKAHEAGIVHRDLKPDNIFLVHNEGDEVAKVLDFGVAKVSATALDGDGHTRTGSLLGTPYYMSPEQAQGNRDIDARSDLWALGVIAFECLTGTRPFSSDGLGDLVLQICIRDIPVPSSINPVPPEFDSWFLKACARDLAERFQSAKELAEELRPALQLEGEIPGSIPESRWSTAGAPPAFQKDAQFAPPSSRSSQAMASNRLGNQTTETDLGKASPTPSPSFDTDSELNQATIRDATASPSQWEILPHGPGSQRSARTPPEALPPVPKTGGSSLFVVAILAILTGGAVVFGVKQASLEGEKNPVPRAARRQNTEEFSKSATQKSNSLTSKKSRLKKSTKRKLVKQKNTAGSPDGAPQATDDEKSPKEKGVEEQPALDAINPVAQGGVEENALQQDLDEATNDVRAQGTRATPTNNDATKKKASEEIPSNTEAKTPPKSEPDDLPKPEVPADLKSSPAPPLPPK